MSEAGITGDDFPANLPAAPADVVTEAYGEEPLLELERGYEDRGAAQT